MYWSCKKKISLLSLGDSTRSEPTEASSIESDFDSSTNTSFTNKTEGKKRCDRQKSGLKFSALAYETFDDGEHRSAFLPYNSSARVRIT